MTIIGISAFGSEEAHECAKAVGFDHYLVKPGALR